MSITSFFRSLIFLEIVGVFVVIGFLLFGPHGPKTEPANLLPEYGSAASAVSTGTGGGGGSAPSSTATPDPSTPQAGDFGGEEATAPDVTIPMGPVEPTDVVPDTSASEPETAIALGTPTPLALSEQGGSSDVTAIAPDDTSSSDSTSGSGTFS